jgi:hypothetical protein
MRKLLCFFSETLGLFGQSLLKCVLVFKTASLRHGTAPFRQEGGSATGVLITDKSQAPVGDKGILFPKGNLRKSLVYGLL